jgi:hypothetical protein
MTDDRLGELLRAAMPPTAEEGSHRDVWRDVVALVERGPRWTMLDFGLAAAAAIALLMYPEWLWVVAYHL